jgi:hypothetical protein
MGMDVVGETRRNEQITPVGLRESDGFLKARELAPAEPNRGESDTVEPRQIIAHQRQLCTAAGLE